MISDESLHQLASKAASGDEVAFQEIIAYFKGRVLSMAARFTWQKHDLDDLVQEVFVRIWKGLPQYRAEAPLEHWVMRVAVRTCYEFARKKKKIREREDLVEITTVQAMATSDTTRTELGVHEAAETLNYLLQHLNPEDRTVIILLELEQQSVAQIAEGLGWSVSKVKTRAHRARKKLQQWVLTQPDRIV